MKRIRLLILGIILLPLYPLLKRFQGKLHEKIQIGERVIVVTKESD